MGAICESDKNNENNSVKPPSKILPQTHIEELPLKDINYYSYKCPIDLSNTIQLNDSQSSHQHKIHLSFVISNILIHQCFSRDKTTKKSLFIFEMQLGNKVFPLFFNYAEKPSGPGRCEEKIALNSFNELSNYYLKINIYEIISEFEVDKLKSFRSNPKLLKTYIPYSKHCSYFQIDLLSFLFRGNKCDFPLLGRKPISNFGRISFQIDIEQLCCYHIIVEMKKEQNSNRKN